MLAIKKETLLLSYIICALPLAQGYTVYGSGEGGQWKWIELPVANIHIGLIIFRKKNHTKIESYIECYQNKKGVFFIKKGMSWVLNTPI